MNKLFDDVKLQRIEAIKSIIEEVKHGIAKSVLVEKLGISSKSIERYIEDIRSFGIEVMSKGRPAYYSIDFEQSEGLEMFEYIINQQILSARLLKTLSGDKSNQNILNYVDFEHHDEFRGLKYFDLIYNAIQTKNSIKFRYKSYYTNREKEVEIFPVLLKEYNYRWYVAGYKINGPHKGEFRTYGLDRILSDIEFEYDANSIALIPKDYNRKSHYRNTIGVTLSQKGEEIEAVEIVFEIDTTIANHAESLKIHQSQKVMSSDSKNVRFSIYARPNFELWHTFFQYIPHIRIVSPDYIRRHLIELMEQTIKKNT